MLHLWRSATTNSMASASTLTIMTHLGDAWRVKRDRVWSSSKLLEPYIKQHRGVKWEDYKCWIAEQIDAIPEGGCSYTLRAVHGMLSGTT
ncbi:hypothetical protein BDV39DRAFT_176106 [Aspergillus sergii]|uniref:Uncharacterized protein n=1 Tax=Aspergillus sergii TaxID=1034303 RepID=A0A5N6X3W3_9EURO|nr:hypothetical protein BDV39DRAFT_176106 [Aspergillus sergii]